MKNFILHAEITRRMLHEHVVFMKRIFIQNRNDPLTGGELTHLGLLFNGFFASPLLDLFLSFSQIENVPF